jgi:glycosyltransferase involved in cell wall biosynthesis
MGLLMLRELLRQGVEVDLYIPTYSFAPPPIGPHPMLRIIERRSRWEWGRWYSRTKAGALFSGLASRSLSSVALSLRLLIEHRRRPYDAVYQLSQTELFLLGRVGGLAPPIVVHPCTHVAGELRWHRAEQSYALRSERRALHFAMRGWLKVRAALQPSELAKADLVLGLSERFNELLAADYGVPRAKLRVVRTPVDVARFTPNGAEGVPEPRTLLFVSRISARKGLEQIVELSHRLNDLAGSVRLLVVGGPTQWSDYRAHLAGLNRNVAEYIPGVSGREMPEFMRGGAMLLVPSLYEPGSIVTAEALACGIPVVLSDEVGNREVAEGPHVRVHRAGDADDLEAQVRSLLAAIDDDWSALRAAARANAERDFTPAGTVSELIEIIASLRSRRSERHTPAGHVLAESTTWP